jgi:hypothetical protein
MSGNGNTLAIGGPTNNSNAGGVWVFTRNGATLNPPSGPVAGFGATGSAAKQGPSVAITSDGITFIEGGPGDAAGVGAAWVFVQGGIPADFDRNGVPDLVWQNDTTGEVGFWYLAGPQALTVLGSLFPTPDTLPGWTLVTVHDMNGDGIPDLIWQKSDTRQVRIWYMTGPQGLSVLGTADPAPGNYPGWRLAAVADMNQDGVPDLVWQNDATRSVGTWYMGGPTGTTVQSIAYQASDNYPGWTLVAAVDMDGNGVPDLIWQNDTTRAVGTWYMSGPLALTQIAVAFQAPGSVPGWKVVGVTDMNADGVPDLIWQNDVTRSVGTWYMSDAQATTLLGVGFQAPGAYQNWRAVGPR